SYIASQDGAFRQTVEQQNSSLEGTLLNVLSNQSAGRLFSLRQEFSTSLNRLIHSPANTSVKISITDKYLPIFLRGRNITVTKAELLLRTKANQTVNNFQMTFNGTAVNTFSKDPTMGNLRSADLGAAFPAGLIADHTLTIHTPGDLAPAPTPGDPSVVDE